jgi:hypothetical protein
MEQSDEGAHDPEAKYYDENDEVLTRFMLNAATEEFLAVSRENSWALWSTPDAPLLDIRVKLQRAERFEVAAVMVAGHNGPVFATDLRNVPLGRLVEVINHPELASAIRWAMGHGTGYDWAPDAPSDPGSAYNLPAVPAPEPVYTLDGVHDVRRSKQFYVDVAAAWSVAIANGHREPARVLADANQVPITTVHGWVSEARRRKVMAPSGRRSPSPSAGHA